MFSCAARDRRSGGYRHFPTYLYLMGEPGNEARREPGNETIA